MYSLISLYILIIVLLNSLFRFLYNQLSLLYVTVELVTFFMSIDLVIFFWLFLISLFLVILQLDLYLQN